MIYAGIIKRLRETCPTFERRIGGTALFESLSKDDNSDMKMPHAFVVPLHETADERADMAQYNQKVKERFAVIVAVGNSENRSDGLGLIAMDIMRAIRQEFINSLLKWEPLPHYDACQYVGARHLTMTRVRLWRQFEFSTAYYISPDARETCTHLKEAYIRAGIRGYPRDNEPFVQWFPEDAQSSLSLE